MLKQILVVLVLAVLLSAGVESAAMPVYEIGDQQVEIANSILGIHNPVYDHTGTKVAWMENVGSEAEGYWWEIWICDLNKPEVKIMVAGKDALVGSLPAWSPDGNNIFFGSRKYATVELPEKSVIAKVNVGTGELVDTLKPSDIGFSDESFDIRTPSIIAGATQKLIFSLIDWTGFAGGPYSYGIYCVDIDSSGAPLLDSLVRVIRGDNGFHLFLNPVLSPDANTVFAEAPNEGLEIFRDIADIIAGNAPTINGTAASENRAFQIINAVGCHAMNPRFSQDGRLGFFSQDINCIFNDDTRNINEADFDIKIFSVDEAINTGGSPTLYPMPYPGNQGPFAASPGGTRLVYATYSDLIETPSRLYLCALKISDSVALDGLYATASDLTIVDGSGTMLFIPANTTVTGLAGDALDISVYTPISPLEEIATVVDGAVLVRRAFTPTGIGFIPPEGKHVTLTIGYTDQEVRGIDENTLTIVQVTETVKSLQGIEIIERDTANNKIKAAITGFGSPVAKAGGGACEFVVFSQINGDVGPEGPDPRMPASTNIALAVLMGAIAVIAIKLMPKAYQH